MNPVNALLFGWELAEKEAPSTGSETTFLRTARRAMATQFEVMIPFGQAQAAAAANVALDLIDDLEDQLTVFRPHSEISQLNERAHSEAVVVESRLFDLLSFASFLTHETRGAFDIATGALIKEWGFYQRSGRVPSVAERSAAMQRTGMKHVILDAERRTVHYRKAGLEINLGGIGKGYALDRAAQLLRNDWDIGSGLLHGGTSSVLALGTPPGQPRGWMVSLKHPGDENRVLGVVNLRNRALGTSAATYQFFEYNGRKLGHLLDPRKGWPADGMQQVSVVAPSAAEADALSTAFFVMGLEETRLYCHSHAHIGAVILPADEAVPVTLNLEPDDFAACGLAGISR